MRSSVLTWTVYALVDPRDSLPRYVGCTKNLAQRFAQHLSLKTSHNKRRTAWVDELRDAELEPRLRVLAQFSEIGDAEEFESAAITKGLAGGWPLTNAPTKRTRFGPHSSVFVDVRGAMTRRQLEVLRAISALTMGRGFPPTIRELGNALGIASTNGVNDHLMALERLGVITRRDMVSRSIVITEHGGALLRSP